MSGILGELQNNKSKVFRRAYIKRRLLATGLFESEWQQVVQQIDLLKPGRIRFSTTNIVVANDSGRYNPEEDNSSLWFGYASQQRTLLKIEAGFSKQTLGADGIYTNSEVPNTFWDAATYDENTWDETAIVYTGVIQGDININDKNELTLKAMPLTQILRDYPAASLDGYTSTGMVASDFITMVRDHQDSAGSYVFRPFFDDTTTNWNIATTTVNYPTLDDGNAENVIDRSVWDVIEKLAEAENFTAYVDNEAVFNFVGKDAISSATSYEFHGVGSNDRSYGIQIKGIDFFGFRQSKYYSRVQVKHAAADTSTSYETVETQLSVGGGNGPWNYGHKSFQMSNLWLDATAASLIANSIFTSVSAKKKELEFRATFVPHLNINDRLGITYDTNPVEVGSLWDLNTWADTSAAALTGDELTWDPFVGSAISINNDEYRPLMIRVDLDKLETKIIAREV